LIDVPRQQVVAAPLQEIDGEEIAPSRDAVSAVVRNLSLPPSLQDTFAGTFVRRVTLRFRPALPRSVKNFQPT